MEMPFPSSARGQERIRRGTDGRYYTSMIDPRTGELSEARIEPSIKSDDYVNLSFEPYLYCQQALLPERSRQAGFARRPAYGFLKADIGLQNCHVRDPDIMGQQDLEAKARDLGPPDVIMAPWAYPDAAQVTLKVQWRDGSKSFTTRSTWNTVIEGGQKRIDSFWEAVGQLKPPLLAEQGCNRDQRDQEPTDLQTRKPDVHLDQTEPQIYTLTRHYPILTSLLSQLSASDTAIFLALIPGLLYPNLQAKYIDPTRDLPDSSWWKEKISQGFEIYLVGLQAGLLWERIYQPLKYWAEDRPQVLRVWVVAIAPDAERRRRGDGAAGEILNNQDEYVIHKNWELDWYTTGDLWRRPTPNVNSRPYYPCGNSSCAGCPFVDPLLPPPFVFEATNCQRYQMDWFIQGGSRIELAWKCMCVPHLCPPEMILCDECRNCPTTVFDIGGICNDTTSVPYICLSTKQLATSTLYETHTGGSIGDPIFEIVVSIRLSCFPEQRQKRRLMHIKRLQR